MIMKSNAAARVISKMVLDFETQSFLIDERVVRETHTYELIRSREVMA